MTLENEENLVLCYIYILSKSGQVSFVYPLVNTFFFGNIGGLCVGKTHGKCEETAWYLFPLACLSSGRWQAFQAVVSEQREAVDSALRVNNYCVDCEETSRWIMDKTKVVESTKELGQDLAGVIAIQRKLSGLERDVLAIRDRVSALARESQYLMESHPEQKEDIGRRQVDVETLWKGLQDALQGQELSLGEASKLQAFLQELDDFQTWLSMTQKAVASEDMPESLPEAEQLLQQHAAIKEEVDAHKDKYHQVKASGEKVIEGQSDPEYQLLGQRLEGLDAGWDALWRMWESRGHTLTQCLGFQEFQKDAKQAEAILSNQVGRSTQGWGTGVPQET